MSDEPSGYQVYLLRLWRVRYKGKWQWRASLQSPHTEERQLFAGLPQLFAFLGERCDGQEGETQGWGDTETRRSGDAERLSGQRDSSSEGEERRRR